MDWTQPLKVDFNAGNSTGWDRLTTFFGHYDCRIYLSPTAYLEVGAGSLQCARRVQARAAYAGCIGSIGRFCEFSECDIQFGAAHRHDEPVNLSFGPAAAHRWAAGSESIGLLPPRPIRIGNNVVISRGAIVLDGVEIGDGAVIGAGAVVTKDVAPFAVYAGVPARKIRDRMAAEKVSRIQAVRWWDFSAAYMCEFMPQLQNLALEARDHPRIADRPRFVLRFNGTESVTVVGVSNGDQVLPLDTASNAVRAYVSQALGDGPYYWLADVWSG